jgi:hypothetical protein
VVANPQDPDVLRWSAAAAPPYSVIPPDVPNSPAPRYSSLSLVGSSAPVGPRSLRPVAGSVVGGRLHMMTTSAAAERYGAVSQETLVLPTPSVLASRSDRGRPPPSVVERAPFSQAERAPTPAGSVSARRVARPPRSRAEVLAPDDSISVVGRHLAGRGDGSSATTVTPRRVSSSGSAVSSRTSVSLTESSVDRVAMRLARLTVVGPVSSRADVPVVSPERSSPLFYQGDGALPARRKRSHTARSTKGTERVKVACQIMMGSSDLLKRDDGRYLLRRKRRPTTD